MELKKYWEILWRRKLIVLITIGWMILFTILLFLITPTVYQSKSKILIKPKTDQQLFIKGVPNTLGDMPFYNSQDYAMGTIEELLESEPVVLKVIQDMSLKNSDSELLKLDDFVDPFFLKLFLQGSGVDIENLEASETFEIIGYSTDSKKAKQISEGIINNFLNQFSLRYRNNIEKAKSVVMDRIPEMKRMLYLANKALADYKQKSQLYNTTNQINMLVSEMKELESEKDKTVRALEESRANLKNIQDASLMNPKDFREVQSNIESNPLIDDYKRQLVALESNLAKFETEKTSEHPDVKTTKQQISVLKENIKKEVSRSFASQITGRDPFYDNLSSTYAKSLISVVESQVRIKTLNAQMKEKQKILDTIPEKEAELNTLMSEADSIKLAYNSLLSDLENIKSAEKLNIVNAVVVQPSPEGTIYFPPEDMNIYLAIAAFSGLFFGIFFAYLFNYIDTTLITPEDAKKATGRDISGKFMKIKNLEKTLSKASRSPFAGAVFDLFANIKTGGKTVKTLSIVSPSDEDGKTTAACHIATVLADTEKKVVLVDGNLRSPGVHNVFDMTLTKGLSNYFTENLEIDSIISKTFMENLHIITAGTLQLNEPQKYLESGACAKLLNELKNRYDLVIIDTPSESHGADALLLSAISEGTVMIIREGRNPKNTVVKMLKNFSNAKADIIAILLNCANKTMRPWSFRKAS